LNALAATTTAHTDGGWKEIDATNAPGLYRVDFQDAAFATGVNDVYLSVSGAANLRAVSKRVQLVSVNMQDAVRGGMTALPNANAEAAGGLFTRGTGTGQINQDANGRIDVNLKAIVDTGANATNLGKTTSNIARGTVAAASSTTSVTTGTFTPTGAVADQFKGRTMLFDVDTTTTALRGQATDITASSNAALPVFTVTALTTAPQTGDTFSII
jgi:hypothetical protein